MNYESFITVVIPVYEFSKIKFASLHQELVENFTDFEIILVSDSECKYSQCIEEVMNDMSCIRHISLSGSVDKDVRFAAGCENSVGDFVILFSLDLDPISSIIPLYRKCTAGNDIVIGISKQRSRLLYPIVRDVFGFILKGIGYNLPKNSTDLRCLSRRAVNTVTRVGRYHHKFYMRIHKSGYRQTTHLYNIDETTPRSNNGQSKFNKLMSLLVFNSTLPLRWMSVMGFLGSFLAFLYASYSLVIHTIEGNVADGWTTTIFFISSLFMIQFIIISFLGEYLARLLDEKSDKDDYSVIFEKNSVVMVNEDRVNVMNDSEIEHYNLVQTGRNK